MTTFLADAQIMLMQKMLELPSFQDWHGYCDYYVSADIHCLYF